jgi:hypothetical protein
MTVSLANVHAWDAVHGGRRETALGDEEAAEIWVEIVREKEA